METELIRIAVASFVSGLTGAAVGGVVVVVSMRVDIRWIKEQMREQHKILHDRIDKTKAEFTTALGALRKRIDDTRDLVLGRRP